MNFTPHRFNSNSTQLVLSDDRIRQLAPSVFAQGAHESRSERYLYVPTARILTAMRQEGFMPVAAAQGRSRIEGKAAFTKHMIRFRHQSEMDRMSRSDRRIGDVYPEVVMINSHDGTSSYRLIAGLLRLICLNGMVTGETFKEVKVSHTLRQQQAVIEGSYEVIQESRRALGTAEAMAQVSLDRDERAIFAEAVHELRFSDTPALGNAIRPSDLLIARRREDLGTDLWSTFNVAQENSLRGGISGHRLDEHGRRVNVTTRAVGSIDGSTSLNRALWTLAERMAELKGARLDAAA
jgi:hypothetical protein